MKNRLRVLRAEQNWSQQELGMRVGVTRQAINAIENGKYDPGLPLAMKIARAFDQKVDDIFQLEDEDQCVLSATPNISNGRARKCSAS